MPDPLDINPAKSTDASTSAEDKKEDPNKEIMETLASLNDTIAGLTGKVDDIQNKWDDFETKNTPAEPAKEDKEPEFKPQSWDDFPKMAEDKAKAVFNRTLKELEEEQEKVHAENERQKQEIDKEIDGKIESLEKAGKIPPMKNADDPNDPGRSARRELYGFAAKMDTLNLEQVADTLNTMHKQGLYYDFKSNKYLRRGNSQAGQDAPVGSSGGSSGYGEDKPDYPTIHKARSLSELARRAGM